MANTITKEQGKVSVSDVIGKLVYYVDTNNGSWFDGHSKDEILSKASYMGIDLDWSECQSA